MDGSTNTWDFSETYERLKGQYQATRQPVEVNFRRLVPIGVGVDRATHLLHPYPAKVLLNIPLFFLRCKQFGPPGHLLDPFCGSGTVLVEGAFNGWRVSGADSNPLARLITKVKLTPLDSKLVSAAFERVRQYSPTDITDFSPVLDVNRWFAHDMQQRIGTYLSAISEEPCPNIQRFFQICLSSRLKKLSFAGSASLSAGSLEEFPNRHNKHADKPSRSNTL